VCPAVRAGSTQASFDVGTVRAGSTRVSLAVGAVQAGAGGRAHQKGMVRAGSVGASLEAGVRWRNTGGRAQHMDPAARQGRANSLTVAPCVFDEMSGMVSSYRRKKRQLFHPSSPLQSNMKHGSCLFMLLFFNFSKAKVINKQ
jgi:hypothetical protein